jgi:4-amino-4-deoxy-L-arabinose transferase-like glycosyltransferase
MNSPHEEKPSTPMTRDRVLVGLFSLVAFAQTLVYYIYLRDDPGNYNGAGAGGDQLAYTDLAQQILHGTWQGAVHYMPGLPAVIALGQVVFGNPNLGIAVIQALVYALVVVYAARLAARAFGDSAGVWAAAAVGLNPAIGYYASQALTEFLTGAVMLALVGVMFEWSLRPGIGRSILAGVLVAAAAYLRAEYLALAPLFALIVLWTRKPAALKYAATLVVATILAMAPWVTRYAIATGTPALYNESPFSNLVLMGTWFRVFDEQTFTELQQLENAPGSRDDAIARAATVGPRPDLSQRYIEQVRGPYELPLGETLSLALGNIQLNWRQYLVNHVVLAPILIWAGRTPVRQADAPHLPATGRYLIWGAELALLLLSLWQAVLAVRDSRLAVLGVSFLAIVVFLTLVHLVIGVDERFTTPALPLIGVFAGGRLALLLTRSRQPAAVRYAA